MKFFLYISPNFFLVSFFGLVWYYVPETIVKTFFSYWFKVCIYFKNRVIVNKNNSNKKQI